MGAHRGPHHLWGQNQKRGIHLAQNRRRPLGEPRHLFEKPKILDELQARLSAERPRAFSNHVPSTRALEDHEPAFQLILVGVKCAGLEGAPGAHKPVTLGLCAGLKTVQRHGRRFAVKDAEDAPERPDPPK